MFKRYRIGNAQIIGRREVQSNYFTSAFSKDGGVFAILADGSIDHANGRMAAVLAVEHCADSLMWHTPGEDTLRFFYDTAVEANIHIQDKIYMGKSPKLSLTMIFISAYKLYHFNVGMNRVCLYDGNNERLLSGSLTAPYSCGKHEIKPKNIVALFSDGAFKDAHPMERIKILGTRKKVYDKAQDIVDAKGLSNQVNATALLVEVVR